MMEKGIDDSPSRVVMSQESPHLEPIPNECLPMVVLHFFFTLVKIFIRIPRPVCRYYHGLPHVVAPGGSRRVAKVLARFAIEALDGYII